MLVGIIKEEKYNDSYYIYLNNNKKELSIIHTNDNRIESLTREKAIKLLKTILSSKITYNKKENDYDIYFDEANNKRYFKDGKENYFLFIENNGIDSICYFKEIKKYNTHKTIKIICGTLAFLITASPVGLLEFAHNITYNESPPYELVSIEQLTAKEMVQEIKNSPYLTDEEKELLANETYFEFILRNATTADRYYCLRERLKDINIKNFEKEEFEGADGFYSSLEPNTIHLLKGIEESKTRYNDVLVHEFIHLTQHSNKYSFIKEASAELLEQEFFNLPGDTYSDAVTRVRALMEIIGPQPIIECNFKDNTKSFEAAINKYLNEEDANELLELFTLSVLPTEETKDLINSKNKRIDELLSKMYKNKTGKDIKSDRTITEVRKAFTDRIYFNPNHEDYNNDLEIYIGNKEIGTVTLDEALKYAEIDCFAYRINKSKDKKRKIYIIESTKDFNSIPFEYIKDVTINYKNGEYSYIKYKPETKEWSKATIYSKEQIKEYEPSLFKKFPDQTQQKIIIQNSNSYDAENKKTM